MLQSALMRKALSMALHTCTTDFAGALFQIELNSDANLGLALNKGRQQGVHQFLESLVELTQKETTDDAAT